MDSTLRSVIKVVLVGTVLLMLAAIVFLAGFGSAYLLTGSGVLPTWSAAAPTSTPAPPLPDLPPEGQAEETAPRPTPMPIPTPTSADEEAFQLFWEVWGLVQRNFYGDLPGMQEVTYAAIHGVLNTLIVCLSLWPNIVYFPHLWYSFRHR